MSLVICRTGDVICVEPFKAPWIVRYVDVDGNVSCQLFNVKTCKGEGDFIDFKVTQIVHKYLKLTRDAAMADDRDHKQKVIDEIRGNLVQKYGKLLKNG